MRTVFFKRSPSIYGGPATFMKAFEKYARKSKNFKYEEILETSKKPSAGDVIFGLNLQFDIPFLRAVKSAGVKYIHRANGVYRHGKMRDDWKNINNRLKKIVEFSDAVIFQSGCSKRQYMDFLGAQPKKYNIILNGIDLETVPVCKNVEKENRIVSIMNIAEFKDFKDGVEAWWSFRDELDAEYLIIGKQSGECSSSKSWTMDDLEEIKASRPGLRIVEEMNRENLFNLLKSSLFYFDPRPLAACPNATLEALAAGLPVASIKNSGSDELAGNAGCACYNPLNSLRRVKERFLWEGNGDISGCSINRLFSPVDERVNYLAYEKCFAKYEEVFSCALE